jgi:hypothetical protein
MAGKFSKSCNWQLCYNGFPASSPILIYRYISIDHSQNRSGADIEISVASGSRRLPDAPGLGERGSGVKGFKP